MEYEIHIPIPISNDYFNLGIDFAPQTITGVIKGENVDRTIIDFKKYGLSLDNRYLKNYQIIKEKDKTIIRITVE